MSAPRSDRRACAGLLSVFMLLSGFCNHTAAQTSINGSLRGRITDQDGAAVTGVLVMLSHRGTNARQTTTTGEDGSYLFARVVPGRYLLATEMPGFKQARHNNLVIAVNEAAVAHLTLEVGAVNEIVSIEAGTGVVQSRSAEISGLVNEGRVRQLPLNGLSTPATVDPAAMIGRNALRAPRVMFYDVAMIKRFPVNESINASLEANFFNVFNRANFAGPINSLSNPRFGQIVNSLPGTNPRQVQLGLKLSF
jgi:hypothetical protein